MTSALAPAPTAVGPAVPETGGPTRTRSWPWWLGALGLTLVVTVQPLRDPDVWWHLALGHLILAHGIPATEPFSFAPAAYPWVGQQWAYEVGLARLVGAAGWGVAMLVMGLVAGAAFGLAAGARLEGERTPPWASAAAIVASAAVAGQLLGVRGQVITLLGVAATLYLISRWRRGSSYAAWGLVPLAAVWANLHAGFVAGLALAAASAATVAVWRRVSPLTAPRGRPAVLAAAVVVAAGAVLANPAGPRLYGYVVRTFTDPTLVGSIVEWQSPDFHQTMLRAFELFVATLVVLWTVSRQPDPLDVVLALGTLVASLHAQRNVAIFCVVATPQLARYAGMVWNRWRGHTPAPTASARPHRRHRHPPPPWFAPAVAAVVVAGALAGDVVPTLQPDRIAADTARRYPVAAADYVAAHLAGRRLYSTYEWGGYLAYRFPQGRVVYIYGESAILGTHRLDEYLAVHLLEPGWQDVLTRWGMGYGVVPAGSQEAAAFTEVGWTALCYDPESDAAVLAAPPRPPLAPVSQPPPDPHRAPSCSR